MKYVKVHSSIWDNVKFLALPSHEARLAFIRCQSAAADSDPQGQWPSREYLEAQLRGDPWALAYIDDLLGTELLTMDDDGRIRIPQWKFWQAWEGKRPADQLATEAPAILAKRQQADALRKRVQYWSHPDRIDRAPADLRPHLSGGVSAETHDHTDVRTDGRTSESETRTSADTAAIADASQPTRGPTSAWCGECGREVPNTDHLWLDEKNSVYYCDRCAQDTGWSAWLTQMD